MCRAHCRAECFRAEGLEGFRAKGLGVLSACRAFGDIQGCCKGSLTVHRPLNARVSGLGPKALLGGWGLGPGAAISALPISLCMPAFIDLQT